MKEYMKPEVQYVQLVADEAITGDPVSAGLGMEDNTDFLP